MVVIMKFTPIMFQPHTVICGGSSGHGDWDLSGSGGGCGGCVGSAGHAGIFAAIFALYSNDSPCKASSSTPSIS